MPRISLSDVQSLHDPISSEAYVLQLGTIPNSIGNDRELAIKCLNANMPGFSNEAFEVNLHSHVRNVRGRKMYPRTLAVTYIEDSTLHTTNLLRSWSEFIVGSQSGTSAGDIAQYSVTANLQVFNHQGTIIQDINFFHFFIQEVPDVQLTGESSTLMQIPVTFKYDHFLTNIGPVTTR